MPSELCSVAGRTAVSSLCPRYLKNVETSVLVGKANKKLQQQRSYANIPMHWTQFALLSGKRGRIGMFQIWQGCINDNNNNHNHNHIYITHFL